MGLKGRLRRAEKEAAGLHHALTLPDGTKVRYTGEEMLDAVLAAIDEEEHHLLPYLRQMDTTKGIAGLVEAIEGSNADE